MIASLDPAAGFIRMVAARPAPEHCLETMPHTVEHSLGDDVSMVVGPAPQERAELADQNRRGESTALANQLPRLLQHAAHALSRWSDQQFVSVLAHLLSQEIKTLGDVRDERLFFREFESALPEELDDDRLDFLLQDFLAGRSDHKIIRPSVRLASAGEAMPPCGVPAVVGKRRCFSMNPALSHWPRVRRSIGM